MRGRREREAGGTMNEKGNKETTAGETSGEWTTSKGARGEDEERDREMKTG